jgi:uncharacterized protein YbjT (DUF2867 family)
MAPANNKPNVLVLGVTGQLGRLVADRLQKNDKILLTVTSRKRDPKYPTPLYSKSF